jgi:hypothetical protein
MAIIPVHSGDNLQTKITAMAAGDILELDAGVTWDGNFTLPNVSGASSGNPLTIRSANYTSLPSGRVAIADATNMPRIRTSNGTAVFTSTTNAAYWILDGLEITDNITDLTLTAPNLIDLGNTNTGPSNITVQRCYLHQKETGTNWVRCVYRAIQFEGSGLLYKWCYVGPFLGYYHPETGQSSNARLESSALLSVSGNVITVEDNYLNAWWNTLFLGGGDTAPQNTATLTGATTTSATFSNTTGLAAGIMLRMELHGTGTVSTTGLHPCNSCEVSHKGETIDRNEAW